MNKIAILGSTGSIGTQALDVIRSYPERFSVVALTANTQIDLLEKQINEFMPPLAVVANREAGLRLKNRYHGKTKILVGTDALNEAAALPIADMVLTALSGAVGILPTLTAIDAGKVIALANKETLVAAGDLVIQKAADKGVRILPVDSEHSAIFQCLEGNRQQPVSKLLLTASGGPFRGKTKAELANVSVADCLRHPTWNMGKKITIDSATMFNKGLEIIEAHHLFAMPYDKIEVVIHPQSIVHSMVEFADGAILAQLGMPDMKLPIQLAFSYPKRLARKEEKIDWHKIQKLTFEMPDRSVFVSLDLAYEAGKIGMSAPLVLNAANEVAVTALLKGEISFLQVFEMVERALQRHTPVPLRDYRDIYLLDKEIRREVSADITNA